MQGWIVINGFTAVSGSRHQCRSLAQAFATQGVTVTVKKNDGTLAWLQGGQAVCPERPDFCVYLDKDKYTSRLLEQTGVRLFNSHEAIRLCDDKMETFLALQGQGLPLPDTIPAPLCYDPAAPLNTAAANAAEQRLGYPLVVKESFGSLGRGVHLAHNRPELLGLMERLRCQPYLLQRAVVSGFGRDVRVIVIGGRAIGGMLRQSSGDFRSNLALGGHGEPFPLSTAFRRISEQAAQRLGLDYAGVDLLFGEDGEPLICEVNSNAFFEGFEAVTGVPVAPLYAEHILSIMKGTV